MFEGWGGIGMDDKSLGEFEIDHIGVTTADVDGAIASLAGAKLLRGPMDNVGQGVRQAFVRVDGGPIIELLSPLPGASSPIARHVREGGGAHHICFIAGDLLAAIDGARGAGAILVAGPSPDVAFDQRSIAFLQHPMLGLIEFVEAARRVSSVKAAAPAGVSAGVSAMPAAAELDAHAILQEILPEAFPGLERVEIINARLDATPGWDSLGHLRLMILLERRLAMTIPSPAIPELTDYKAILAWLNGRRTGAC